MRVLAIDPGYGRMGVAVLEGPIHTPRLFFSTCISTPAALDFNERMLLLVEKTGALFKEWQPSVLVLEKLFLTKNQKTVMRVSEVRGMLIAEASRRGVTVAEYSPLEVKVAVTGYGKSTKEQVATMLPRLIKIKKTPRYDDEVDAIALGLTYLATRR